MKIIRITTENDITVHDYPSSEGENDILRELIGVNCELFQRVRPRRLYTELAIINDLTKIDGESVCMLVDEDGLLRDLEVNLIGSYLYETDKHGSPIVGNVLFIGEKYDIDGLSFCGIADHTFRSLFPKLEHLVKKAGSHQ